MPGSPNILLIWTDQQRNDSLPCNGNDFVQAPNLDRLTNESFVFRHAYCAQPVCTPSRASILSGLYPHTHGCVTNNIPLDRNVKTLAQMLPEEYHCGYYGKWHLGDELVPQRGFDDWISIEDGIYRGYYSKAEYLQLRSSYHHFLVKNGFAPDSVAKDGAPVFSRDFAAVMDERYTKASFLSQEASRFLGEQSADRPFFLSVNFLEPHPPIFGPLNYLYDPDSLPVGDAFLKKPGDDMPQKTRDKVEELEGGFFKRHPLNTEWDWRRLRANYFGLITQIDKAVGKIVSALEATGQADNTLIVYTSDHGEMVGDHYLMGKGVIYEESSCIPLFMKVPWISRERTMIDGPISQVDLVPTVLDLVGGQIQGHLQGESRAGVLSGGQSLDENEVIVEWNHDGEEPALSRTLITADRWKLTLRHEDKCELFDMNSDPCELTDLFNHREQQGRIRDMSDRIGAWQERTGDFMPLPV